MDDNKFTEDGFELSGGAAKAGGNWIHIMRLANVYTVSEIKGEVFYE
ncbi:hypothetical protein FACS1894219_10490 [Clostridia bacterium]|nr:hypothetical protein FACS1894219_10490 [Clostridia bacterium]